MASGAYRDPRLGRRVAGWNIVLRQLEISFGRAESKVSRAVCRLNDDIVYAILVHLICTNMRFWRYLRIISLPSIGKCRRLRLRVVP